MSGLRDYRIRSSRVQPRGDVAGIKRVPGAVDTIALHRRAGVRISCDASLATLETTPGESVLPNR